MVVDCRDRVSNSLVVDRPVVVVLLLHLPGARLRRARRRVDLSESISALLLLVVAVQLLQELVDVCGSFCTRALGSLMVSGLAFLALLFLDLVCIGD